MATAINIQHVVPKQPTQPKEVVKWENAAQVTEIAEWTGGSIKETKDGYICVLVKTLIGPVKCEVGDTIVKDPDGVITLISEDVLHRNYVSHTDSIVSGGVAGLDFMLDLQRDVENAWGRLPDHTDHKAVSQYLREVVLCATDELHEVLAEVHWKPWKTNYGIKNIENYRGELADVVHFVLDLYLAAGLTGDDIIHDYMAKHDENIVRTSSEEYRQS